MNDNAKHLMTIFAKHGAPIRMAGGCVRDHILGVPSKDIDFCTTATPARMKYICKYNGLTYIPTGIAHGTMTIMVRGEGFEVTTLRVDVNTDGRHAEVQFTDDFEADAARRDLTINSMMMDAQGRIFDPFGGQEDLKNGVIRFVGQANKRVQEDYLRILRFFRFADKFDEFTFDADGLQAIAKHAEGLKNISMERIVSEMFKIVMSRHAKAILSAMSETGVLKVLGFTEIQFPENLVTTRVGRMFQFFDAEGRGRETAMKFMMTTRDRYEYRFMAYHCGASDIVTPIDAMRYIATADNNANFDRQWIVNVLQIKNAYKFDIARMLTFVVPPLPVNGHDLMDQGIDPRMIGNTMTVLRRVFFDAHFILSREGMLDTLDLAVHRGDTV